MFKGSLTALITPFKTDEARSVDEDAFRRLVEWQIAEGTHGLVPAGTTGESPTLTYDEHKRIIAITVQVARGRVPVIAGTGSNSTAEAIELSRHAEADGASGLLVVAPYYNKPTQEGLYQHFKKINDSVGIPIIVYNIPGRTNVDISIDTMARLSELRNIAGVKDATASLSRVARERRVTQKTGRRFVQLSGEDETALAFMAHGGEGCISVASNIAPRLCAEFQNACLRGDYAAAREIQDRLQPIHETMFIETNPGPVKYAASRLGLCSEEMRLPLWKVSVDTRRKVDAALAAAGLLHAKAAE